MIDYENLEKILEPALLKFLEDTKADLEKRGYIPTLDLAIEQYKERMAKRKSQ